MRLNGISALAVCSSASLFFLHDSTTMAWSASSSYSECVLAEMRDEPGIMLLAADQVCEKQFPIPVSLDSRQISANWCEVTPSERQLCIVGKPDNYEIRDVELNLYPCALRKPDTPSQPQITLIEAGHMGTPFADPPPDPCLGQAIKVKGEKSYFSDTYTFKIPQGNYVEENVGYIGFTNR